MKKQDRIKVVLFRFGSDPDKVEVSVDSTVDDLMKELNITLKTNEVIWVNGEKATRKDVLEDNDQIIVVSPKEAGL